MDKNSIDKVCRAVYRKFPALKNKRPKVSQQRGDRFLLTFSGSGKTPDGKTIKHQIRVVATATGKIIKISSSR